jgi:tryptophan-rich sensory protein
MPLLQRRQPRRRGEARVSSLSPAPLASLLLVPYALWLAFATALTRAIWARN